MNKKGWKRPKKVFQPAFGCAQHPKAGQNTQQMLYLFTDLKISQGSKIPCLWPRAPQSLPGMSPCPRLRSRHRWTPGRRSPQHGCWTWKLNCQNYSGDLNTSQSENSTFLIFKKCVIQVVNLANLTAIHKLFNKNFTEIWPPPLSIMPNKQFYVHILEVCSCVTVTFPTLTWIGFWGLDFKFRKTIRFYFICCTKKA